MTLEGKLEGFLEPGNVNYCHLKPMGCGLGQVPTSSPPRRFRHSSTFHHERLLTNSSTNVSDIAQISLWKPTFATQAVKHLPHSNMPSVPKSCRSSKTAGLLQKAFSQSLVTLFEDGLLMSLYDNKPCSEIKYCHQLKA